MQGYDRALATDVDGGIHYYDGATWTVIPGSLVDPSMGADGSLWGVNGSGAVCRRASINSSWQRIVAPRMVKIDALDVDHAVALDSTGQLFHFDVTSWTMAGAEPMMAISYSADGSLWAINRKGEAMRALSVGSPWEIFYHNLKLIDIDALDYYRALGISACNTIFKTNGG